MDALKWISSRLLITEFIDWVKDQKGESFNYNLFKRAKLNRDGSLTDRQMLLIEFAEEFATIQQEKRNELAQMSPA